MTHSDLTFGLYSEDYFEVALLRGSSNWITGPMSRKWLECLELAFNVLESLGVCIGNCGISHKTRVWVFIPQDKTLAVRHSKVSK